MSRERNEVRPLIRKMANRIVRKFHPEKIILFGSRARCDARKESDVDILVVMPVSGEKREKRLEIRGVLQDMDIDKDIIVSTPDEFAWRSEIPGTIERFASLDGRILYAKR